MDNESAANTSANNDQIAKPNENQSTDAEVS